MLGNPELQYKHTPLCSESLETALEVHVGDMAAMRDRLVFALVATLIAVTICSVKADLVVVRADRKVRTVCRAFPLSLSVVKIP